MKRIVVLLSSLFLAVQAVWSAATPSENEAIAALLKKPVQFDIYSSVTKKKYTATIEVEKLNAKDGTFVGRLNWPNLGSIHRIEGKIAGGQLTFKETAYIKKGGAHLNCAYALKRKGDTLTGSWEEPGKDKGTVASVAPEKKSSTTAQPAAPAKPETASTKPTATPTKPAATPAKTEKPAQPTAGSSASAPKETAAATPKTVPAAPKTPAASPAPASAAPAATAALKVSALPPPPQEEIPADARGYYKLVEIEFFLRQNSDGSYSYGPKSTCSSFTADFRLTPIKDATGPFNWATATYWSFPEILVPGKAHTFRLAGSSTRDEYSALLGMTMGRSEQWSLAAVRRGLKARMGGSDVPDVSAAEYTVTLPKEIAGWRDKATWPQPATIRVPDSEMGAVYAASGSSRVTAKTPADIPAVVRKLTVKDWMYGEGSLQDIQVHIAAGSILNRDAVARYTYKWQDRSAPTVGVEITTDPANRRELRADGKDAIVLKARIVPSPQEKADVTRNKTRGIRFSAIGAHSAWAKLDNTMMSGDWQCVTVRAVNPAAQSGATTPPPPTLQIRAAASQGAQTLELKLLADAAELALSPDRFECLLGSGSQAQVKVEIKGTGPAPWKIRAEYERNARRFATFDLKQTDGTHAVIDLKEAGLKPERGDDNIDTATLLVIAEQKGRPPLQAALPIRLVQEGIFLADTNRNPQTGAFTVHADGKKTATEIDYRLFALNAKTKQVANLTTDSAVRKKIVVECLEKPSSEAARLLASGQLQIDATRLRQLNEPAGTVRLAFARELPSDGRVVPARFRLRYPDRKEEAFSAPFTLGIATTANGPGSDQWKVEVERCETIINKFVPVTYRPRLQAMLDQRKQTLGAGGLYLLRQRIWSVATHLTLAEGGKAYENEAAWADTITSTLEFAKVAGDYAFDVAAGMFTSSPYGALAAGQVREIILSAIEAYQEGRDAKTWAWEYLTTIPELVEGQIIDRDRFEQWGVKSKIRVWLIFVGYHFLKNLAGGASIYEACKETLKTSTENVFTGWLGDITEKHGDRSVSELLPGKKPKKS